MNRFALAVCVAAIAFSPSSATAVPPVVTYLYPAGAQRGTTAEITAGGTFDTWPVNVWVSGTGVSVVAGKDKGKFAVTVAKDATPGVYWLRAHNPDGASVLRAFFVGVLPEITEKEPNDDVKKPQVLDSTSVLVNGRLEKPGDVDCFAVMLKKGQTLVASLEANRILKSPMDAILQVVSPDGFVLDENHDYHGLDPQLAFTATKDGTYIVRLFAFPSMPDSSIRFFGSEACVYRLTLATMAFADFALPLAVGPDGPRKVELLGWNAPGELPIAPLAASQFTTLTGPNLANVVRVRNEPHPAFDRDQEGVLKPPFSVTKRIIISGISAVVEFEGKKGQSLSLEVQSRTLGLGVNPVVRILDKDKKPLARAEQTTPTGDTALSFTPLADGVYRILVNDLYGKGGEFRDYFLLRVLLQEPDYELSVAADRFTVVPGPAGKQTIPVKITRKNGFTAAVDIVGEGLPEGVKLEVIPAAKPDPGTVMVTLTAEKPVSGAFRLVGKVKDDPKRTRAARVVVPDSDESTTDLWLTATANPPLATKKP